VEKRTEHCHSTRRPPPPPRPAAAPPDRRWSLSQGWP
jgi:hypothetical protein